MDITANVCNRECVKKGKNLNEFIGPIKIVLINPSPRQYFTKTFGAGVVALANMLMGASTVIVLLYSFSHKLSFANNLHVFFCTAGFQLLIPSGILLHNVLNGVAGSLKESDKNIQHVVLQAFGLTIAIIGSVFIIRKTRLSVSVHCFTGIMACVSGIITSLIGPIAYFVGESALDRCMKATHAFTGILTFILSSICFVFGILEKEFKSWLPFEGIANFMVCFCIFYSIVVIYFPIRKHIVGGRHENDIEECENV